MKYFVKIVAQDVQVTANNIEEAERFAEDDAREFYADWSYLVEEIRPARADEEPTSEDDDDFVLEVESVDDDQEEEGEEALWTFDASFSLVVEADTPEQAGDIAKFYYSTEKYGAKERDPERGAQAIAKILEYRAKDGGDLLSTISQIPLDGVDASGMISLAFHAMTEIPSTDAAHDTLERILEFRKRSGEYDGSDAIGILRIASEFQAPEPAASLSP